jgi:hypothetical protein
MLLACVGLFASFAMLRLTNVNSPIAREWLLPISYSAVSSFVLLFGPKWLVDPVGPALRSLFEGRLFGLAHSHSRS